MLTPEDEKGKTDGQSSDVPAQEEEVLPKWLNNTPMKPDVEVKPDGQINELSWMSKPVKPKQFGKGKRFKDD